MFSTKYTQNPTGLSYANIIIISSSSNSIRLISYKINLFGFKYLYKYTDKQTRLPLPRRSDIHSGFKDGWISVGALEDSEDSATKLKDNSTNLTQWISFNKSHSEYPAAFNCFFLFFFFLLFTWAFVFSSQRIGEISLFQYTSDKERINWLYSLMLPSTTFYFMKGAVCSWEQPCEGASWYQTTCLFLCHFLLISSH